MQPHREEERAAEQKPKRFRILKLEERIAPSNGHNTNGHGCVKFTNGCPTQGTCYLGCTYQGGCTLGCG
jgi:hypothetical protein